MHVSVVFLTFLLAGAWSAPLVAPRGPDTHLLLDRSAELEKSANEDVTYIAYESVDKRSPENDEPTADDEVVYKVYKAHSPE
ncbi:MAG: hypothetical protein M1818_008388 [Claussenomyces sp. TS43310]|nr:MAG: hypothetical protein M1818_008388 [Claussenomyces sp. TS43310]